MAEYLGDRNDGVSKYTQTYTTFSGSDIVCSFGGTPIGTLSGITWSVTREKAPIYTMGSPNPRSFSRGKRGIAGSLIFTTFDRPALYDLLSKNINNEAFKIYTRAWNVLPNLGSTNNKQYAGAISSVENDASGVMGVMPYYADQIPPFDVTVTFANEYGQAAVKSIYGVELLNEGSGTSMDDIMIEETMTFVAREIGPMVPTNRAFTQLANGVNDAAIAGI
jgi:hypothetical protein